MNAIEFPERYHLATQHVDAEFGDLESNETLSNENKLILYALRQQADVGPCAEPAPYFWNVAARYKHSSWLGLGVMSKPEAMVHYTRHLEKVSPAWPAVLMARAAAVKEEAAAAAAAAEASAAPQLGGRGDSIELLASPPRFASAAVASLASTPVAASDRGTATAAAGAAAAQHADNVAAMSDAQVAALAAAPAVSRAAVRGLVAEVLSLRRQLVMATAVAAQRGSAASAVLRSPRVEHRYYTASNDDDAAVDAGAGDASAPPSAAASVRVHSAHDAGNLPQRANNGGGGGWFSWFGSSNGNNSVAV